LEEDNTKAQAEIPVDMEVEGGKLETEEKTERDGYDFWCKWIKAATKAGKRHKEDTLAAWKEYENQGKTEEDDPNTFTQAVTKCFPIYWASCKVMEPALYSRTPKVRAKREFDIKDPVSLCSAEIAERAGRRMIKESEFDAVMMAAVQDFLHGDKATTQVIINKEVDLTPVDVPVVLSTDPSIYIDAMTGAQYPAQDVRMGATGPYVTVQQPRERKCITPSIASYDEVLHTPNAKLWSEISEFAIKFSIPEHEAKERFPALGEINSTVTWKEGKPEGEDKDIEPIGKYLEGWEIYDKDEKKVRWYSEQYAGKLLDSREDIYKLKGFYPVPPFIINNKPSKHMYPTPVYCQLAPTLKQLHSGYAKVFRLIDAIRRRCLVDASQDELIAALSDLEDSQYIAVDNLQAMLEKGGINNLIYYIPVQELVTAITELNSLREDFKNIVFEFFGVPDILRGAGDPVETATGVEARTGAAHDRFKYMKRQIWQLASDTVNIMLDMFFEVNTEQEIAEFVGKEFMTPEMQRNFSAAVVSLKNDKQRSLRLEIETDSMSFFDDTLKQQQRQAVSQTITAGLSNVSAMMKEDPGMAGIGVKLLLLTLDGMPGGRDFEDGIKQVMQALEAKMAAPPKEEPPPPDYEMMKLQNVANKNQMDMILAQRELDRKDQEMQLNAAVSVAEQRLKEQQAATDARIQEFMMVIEKQRLDLDRFAQMMQAQESRMEEIRLAAEADRKVLEDKVSSQIPEALPQPPQIIQLPAQPAPNMNFTIEMPTPGMRKGKITRPDGTVTEIQIGDAGQSQTPQLMPESPMINPLMP